jgi:sulfur carrier protein
VRVRVNGEDRDLAEGTSLPRLLDDLGLGVGWVVVERNGTALLRSEAEHTVLTDGDVLEIVRAVAGG